MKKTSLSRRLRRSTWLLVLLAGWTAVSGQVIYVDADAPGADDGTSWENAYNFLQDALADARISQKEIWVAQGVYTPDCNSAIPQGTGDREAAFELVGTQLTLRGGYAGFGAPDPNARDFSSYETILSGDLDKNDGPNFANYDENSYHVVLAMWTNSLLEGFTITGGNATGAGVVTVQTSIALDVGRDSGGGLYNSYMSGIKIANCRFHKNKALWGGGIYNDGDYGQATLTDCVFSQNTAFGGGGAYTGGMRNFFLNGAAECKMNLDNCTFEENTADLGGAMCSQSYHGVSTATLPTVTDCKFMRNTATYNGGAIYNNRGNLTLTGSNFVANSTLMGGGLMGGGALYSLDAAPLNVANCVFSGNVSAAVGGAMYVGSCRPGSGTCGGQGGGNIDTSTFAGNKAADSGGAVCWGIGRAVMTNCILWGNIAPDGKEMALDPHNVFTAVFYSDVEGGKAGVFYMDPSCLDREPCGAPGNPDPNCKSCELSWYNNIDPIDPCFADPGYWHTNGTADDTTDDYWVNGDYHLKSETGRWEPRLMSWLQDYVTSPCIDTGDPTPKCSSATSPPCYEPFPHSGHMNIGAYARTVEASKSCFSRSSCGILMEGDLNADCVVNGLDLAIMAQHWVDPVVFDYNASWCNAFLGGDMDYGETANRRIDFRDLLVIAEHWCDEN